MPLNVVSPEAINREVEAIEETLSVVVVAFVEVALIMSKFVIVDVELFTSSAAPVIVC